MAFIDDIQMWDMQVEDCHFLANADHFNVSNSQSQGIETISYACNGEKTPEKDLMEYYGYPVEHNENKNKRQNQWRDHSSQSKRRRVLQFDSNEPNSAIQTTSNQTGDSVNDVLSEMSNWLCDDNADETSSVLFHEVLDKSFEEWLSTCFTDSEMDAYDVQNKANGKQTLRESTTMMRKHPILPTRHNSKFQCEKSFVRTSHTSIACPFTILKPRDFTGNEVSLKDINRRIHALQKPQEDYIEYSAFSGKPVVAKTKIWTKGGKGSITVIRTKG